ncbi:uncharacterized protein LY89DRAFT_737659 [Mollisia scopiformis]|uniref:TM7S3/TM198-like domain-containing protein n=1 Tax=Mollisia scopiformis TaxID=149040 RepID=A0A194WXN1_MOLSC|nr:uncharacterized protein LY89DRAFT_737659 [Mollisia scopiformis]KUJ12741.1 hypothetical protein LY89DRAFT_737659 [Mollisia scopiformis]
MMVHATRSRILTILLLYFCVNVAVAERWALHLHRRDGPTTSSTDVSTSQSNEPSQTGSSSGDNGGTTATQKATITGTSNSTSTSSTTSSSSTSTEAQITPVTSNINGATPTSLINLNYTGYNFTLTPDKLPITPEISPGFAVGGVILMVTGAVYTLVGIKNKWLHIYLSAAYLASVAVTVLIIYVMNPPVSNAIQGAYIVAVVMTGLILGGAAIVFTEMTEGLGCLLGGFCLSMWLLVLKPGGLLTSTSGKAIFIASFTIAGFSTSFSYRTRPYGLIVFVSFGGATALVMGIDCFSRAGLKEFWAYLWSLNSNLFPLGATSYPLTRGIRVELASIIVIFLAGVVSQMKLWKIIKERRAQRAAERLKDERTMEQEEENVGRRVEHANAEERGQWEAVYGDKDANKSIDPSNRDSGVGDMDSQKKGPTSTVTSVKGEENIEMVDMPTHTTGAGLVMTNKDGGPITVRVARDPEPTPELDEFGIPVATSPTSASPRNSTSQKPEEEKIWVVGADGEARLERKSSKRHSKRNSNVAPEVVPLPFKVPEGEFSDDRSSVATFADEDPAGQKRRSRHLSAGSMILRKLSQRSHASLRSPRSPRSNRNSRTFTIGEGPSAEDLVVTHGAIEDDRASSIAATMDGLSDDEEMRSIRSSVHQAPDTTEVAGPPQASEIVLAKDVEKLVMTPEPNPLTPEVEKSEKDEPRPVTETAVSDDVRPESDAKEVEDVPQSLTTSTDPKPELDIPKQRKSASNVSAVDSKPSSIKKEHLPAQMSRVVMSYRTNEWAKHLSMADAPDLEELKLAEYPVAEQSTAPVETAVPVRVEELQQTAENATPAPAPSRSASQISNHLPAPTRSNSALSKHTANPSVLERSDSAASAYPPLEVLNRSLSQQSLASLKSVSNPPIPRGFRSVSSPAIPQPIVESPSEAEYPSHSPNLPSLSKFSGPNVPYGAPSTLIGKRDSMIRQKYNPPATLSSTPENPSWKFPSVAAGSGPSSQYPSGPTSVRAESDAGSIYNYPNTNAVFYEEDDENMSLSARRELIRQSSLHQSAPNLPIAAQPLQTGTPPPFDSHQPRRQPSGPSPMAREQQLASWRASVQYDLAAGGAPRNTIERQRSQLWLERQEEEKRRVAEERRRLERDGAFDERMRRGDMLDAHREALRKMQASANRHA